MFNSKMHGQDKNRGIYDIIFYKKQYSKSDHQNCLWTEFQGIVEKQKNKQDKKERDQFYKDRWDLECFNWKLRRTISSELIN